MDTDWTFSSCSWLWEDDDVFKNTCSSSYWTKEDDKAFENALADHYSDADCWDKIAASVPGKTVEDLKLHYEALSDDVGEIESGNVPLPQYSSDVSVCKKTKKSTRINTQKGAPWSEEEHRRFLCGLEKFGRGDWKSISRKCVVTKSNSQVASHAQKYFKRLNSAKKDGKRPSINDITSPHPSPERAAITYSMRSYTNSEPSTGAGKQLLLPMPPFGGMWDPPFCSQAAFDPFDPGCSSSVVSPPGILASPFASQMIEMPMYDLPHVSLLQNGGVSASGLFDIPSEPEFMDLDMFLMPHLLDMD